ncbi:kinase [Micromonospora maritima]|uniref:kinase n=1 Tax=Micromonospora maritima TaxID=986711 RepID=UPI00157D3D47|nr:kinase [Micromonospora maritima]
MPTEPTGSPDTILVCVRGNSGSGKSSIARELRRRHGRGCALVEQDYLRRIVLRERDRPGGAAPALIAQTVRFALDHGYHVVLEGILHTGRHRSMLTALRDGHRGRSLFCYLDVSLPETLRRHLTRPQAGEFTAEQMRGWYAAHDVMGWPDELVLPESTGLDEAVEAIAAAAGLPQTGRDDDRLPRPAVPEEQLSRRPM